MNKRPYTLGAIIFWLVFELISFVTFKIVESNLSQDHEKTTDIWSENYVAVCGKTLNLTYSYQNVGLIGCGYLTFPVFAYLCTLHRDKLLCCVKDPSLICV